MKDTLTTKAVDPGRGKKRKKGRPKTRFVEVKLEVRNG